MIPIDDQLSLQDWELVETFIRASGPGGQNVNKVESAVQLRFDVANSPSLPEDVKARLIKIAGRRVTKDGVLVIKSMRHRTQERNRVDALDRLKAIIARAATAPIVRKATRPPLSYRIRRLEHKRRRGEVKTLRRTPKV